MTSRIFFKLLSGIFCLFLLALATVDYFASHVAEAAYVQILTRQLGDKCRMTTLFVEAGPSLDPRRLEALARTTAARITLVAADGRVLADSEANPDRMENHSNRPELRQAFAGGDGVSIRRSPTLAVDFLYYAVPVSGGALRLAVPLSEINRQGRVVRRKILVSTAMAFLPAIFLAAFASRHISRRFADIIRHAGELARGNFKARLSGVDSSEFGQLARALNETGENMERTVTQYEHEHAELERLERVRKDFVINVSHELRTPLASIQGYAETLLDGALEDRENNLRFLAIIRHNAERLAHLTADLLTLSRVEMKHQEFRQDSCAARELLRDAVDLLHPLAQKKGVRIVEDAPPEDVEVWCDPQAVSQVLSNLVDNAVKYTPAGGSITVGAAPDGAMVSFFVRDTGAGIPAEDLPRLFERFYRVDKARSRAMGGTGLGLSIVKHLVLAQGGQVWVESRVNEGSTFRFTLPAEEPRVAREG